MADIQKSEATLVKKVWDIANVLAAAGVGFTDYITLIIALTEKQSSRVIICLSICLKVGFGRVWVSIAKK